MKENLKKLNLKPLKSAQKAIVEELYIPIAFRKIIIISEPVQNNGENLHSDEKTDKNV